MLRGLEASGQKVPGVKNDPKIKTCNCSLTGLSIISLSCPMEPIHGKLTFEPMGSNLTPKPFSVSFPTTHFQDKKHQCHNSTVWQLILFTLNLINADSYFYGIIGGNSNEKKIWWNLTINASTDKLRIVKYVAKAVNQAFNLHSLSNTCIWYDKFSIDISIYHYLINTWISQTFITYTGTVPLIVQLSTYRKTNDKQSVHAQLKLIMKVHGHSW